LRLAASLERASEHPLGGAIISAAKERGVELEDATDFNSVTGQGVTGKVGGRRVAIGNVTLIGNVGELAPRAEEHQNTGATVVFIAIDEAPAGLIAVA